MTYEHAYCVTVRIPYLREISDGAPMRYFAPEAFDATSAALGDDGFPCFFGLGRLSLKTKYSSANSTDAAVAMTNAGAVNWLSTIASPPNKGISRVGPKRKLRNPPKKGMHVNPAYCTALQKQERFKTKQIKTCRLVKFLAVGK